MNMRNFALYLAFGAGAFISGLAIDAVPPVDAAQPAHLAITTTLLQAGHVGDGYSATIAASGGIQPYTFSATGLPDGLTLDASTGAVTGKPAADGLGPREITLKVTDSTRPIPQTATARLSLSIYDMAAAEVCDKPSPGGRAAWSSSGLADSHVHQDWSSATNGGKKEIALSPFLITGPASGQPLHCADGGWPNTSAGDAHVLAMGRNACFLYETFNTRRCHGRWASDADTTRYLAKFEKHPWGWTSAGVEALAVAPSPVRYNEAAGGIKNAVDLTASNSRSSGNGGYFAAPDSHVASNESSAYNMLGMHVRFKTNSDLSGISTTFLTLTKK
jgi:hypothetical protein